ncbi:MAG: zinc ABC transporter substrate-binding protein, partial [Candidatus Electrothrix sp.]
MQAKAPTTFILSCLLFLATAVVPINLLANFPANTEAPLPIFVSIAPQKWLVEQLGGDLVKTQVLLDKGQEPHTYQPSPEKLTVLFRSRLYFTVGMPFEREIARKINSHKNENTGLQLIDVTTGIKKIPMNAHHHEKKDHEGHDQRRNEEAAGQDLDQEHADPHLWLDPRNVEKLASAMTEA